jgi:hypothetical protein
MKSNKSIFLSLALLCSLSSLVAQTEKTVIGNHGLKFSGLWGGTKHQITSFDNHNSSSYIQGGYFGFEFGKALLIGWGHYDLYDDFKWDNIENQKFDMRWEPLVLGYGFNSFKSIHPQIGLDLGAGKVKLGDLSDRIFVMQPSAGIEINVLRWFHIGLDGGYRFVSDSSIPALSNQKLSGWYGQISSKFGFSWGEYHKKKENSKPKIYEN